MSCRIIVWKKKRKLEFYGKLRTPSIEFYDKCIITNIKPDDLHIIQIEEDQYFEDRVLENLDEIKRILRFNENICDRAMELLRMDFISNRIDYVISKFNREVRSHSYDILESIVKYNINRNLNLIILEAFCQMLLNHDSYNSLLL